jgi:predicted nucleic-acid-binding Zn-ribbon protein
VKKSGACPKCKSTHIVVDAKVRDRGHMNTVQDLSVSTFRNPDAVIFKETRLSTVSAWVCVACGFIELYADTPKTLAI